VKAKILQTIAAIGPEVRHIYVVDDRCPEQSGIHVQQFCTDSRVRVLFHELNLGVGGAVKTGYRQALLDGCHVVVKVDGDGQMDPRLIPSFVWPLSQGLADYTKGNRFFELEGLEAMPKIRLFGNAALSFITKLSTGYWNVFDPTNGYTAIHRDVLARLPLDKVSQRYFFESDMLFRLNILRAVVLDIPMRASYGDEQSSLRVSRVLPEFLAKHLRNMVKRIFYNYYLRDMTMVSIELPLGLLLVLGGGWFGLWAWFNSISSGALSSAGTVMLAALPVMLGVQLLLAALSQDIAAVPQRPFQNRVRA
jgi:glycosyltransferase involved in cell wall biosynthesis